MSTGSYASVASFFSICGWCASRFCRAFCGVDRCPIPSVFSRMNQLHCTVAGGAHVRQCADAVADGPAEPVPRASDHDVSGARLLSNGPPQAVCSGRSAHRPESSTVHFSTMKHTRSRRPCTRPRGPHSSAFSRIASLHSMIGAGCRQSPRYIPETKNATPGDKSARRGRHATRNHRGITHGMPLAILDAPASGRPDASKMGGRPTRQ